MVVILKECDKKRLFQPGTLVRANVDENIWNDAGLGTVITLVNNDLGTLMCLVMWSALPTLYKDDSPYRVLDVWAPSSLKVV